MPRSVTVARVLTPGGRAVSRTCDVAFPRRTVECPPSRPTFVRRTPPAAALHLGGFCRSRLEVTSRRLAARAAAYGGAIGRASVGAQSTGGAAAAGAGDRAATYAAATAIAGLAWLAAPSAASEVHCSGPGSDKGKGKGYPSLPPAVPVRPLLVHFKILRPLLRCTTFPSFPNPLPPFRDV